MQRRKYKDTDGKCFADKAEECTVLGKKQLWCGTYRCPFYKPNGCRDWVRVETAKYVIMFAPEEYNDGKENKQQK